MITFVHLTDDRPGTRSDGTPVTTPGFEYQLRPSSSGAWFLEMRPRDPEHWAAGPWDPMCIRPSLASAIAFIETQQP